MRQPLPDIPVADADAGDTLSCTDIDIAENVGDADGVDDSAGDDNARTGSPFKTSLRSLRGLHGRSSPRASKACMACRRRKARCDGQMPKCGACKHLDLECSMPTNDFRRVKIRKRATDSMQTTLNGHDTEPDVQASHDHNALDSQGATDFRLLSTPTLVQQAPQSASHLRTSHSPITAAVFPQGSMATLSPSAMLRSSKLSVPSASVAPDTLILSQQPGTSMPIPTFTFANAYAELPQMPTPSFNFHSMAHTTGLPTATQNRSDIAASSHPPNSQQNSFPRSGMYNINSNSRTVPNPQAYMPALQALAEAAEGEYDNPATSNRDLEATAALVVRDIEASHSGGSHTPADATRKTLAAQITGVNGSLSWADGGQLRFYGPTSNRHFSTGAAPLSTDALPDRLFKELATSALRKAGEGVDLSSKLETRLLSLYFIWHNPFFHLIDQSTFMKHRALYIEGSAECLFFSLTLYYAILAYSAMFSDEAIAQADGIVEKAGDAYSRKARICLEAEMDYPRETTVQALAIMGSYEVCVGRDARGYLYHSMAVASALDLGLHKDAMVYVEQGRMSKDSYRNRNIVWWGVYLYDRGWSVYVGRLPNAHKDISCPHPHTSNDGSMSYCGSLVSLFRITDTILAEFYSGEVLVLISSTVADCHERLLAWHSSLPISETLDIDLQPSPPAEVLLLHLQYYATHLLLHRPFLGHASNNAFNICRSAATSVPHLLNIYKRCYSFRRMSSVAVHQIFTAATTLVYVIFKEMEGRAGISTKTRADLLVCLAALSALAARMVHARRSYLSVIMLMKKYKISLDVVPTVVNASAVEHTSMPQSQQFEALSHELFQMTNATFPESHYNQPSQLIEIPRKPAHSQEFDNNAGVSAENSSSHTALQSHPAVDTLDFFDFFNVEPPFNAPLGMSDQGNIWSGPSLGDIFDIH